MTKLQKIRAYQYKRGWILQRPWLRTLYSARNRCKNKNHRYCKRGIKCFLQPFEIKSLWHRDKAWLLKEPSIDRINNNGNYTYENCRFIELRKNTSLGNLGRIHPKEMRLRISASRRGYTHSKATRKKLSLATFRYYKKKHAIAKKMEI